MKKKKVITFPDDQYLAQNEVKTKKKKVFTFADVGHENIGEDAFKILGGYIA